MRQVEKSLIWDIRILKMNKKNIKTNSATYSGYWCSLDVRFKRIIERTTKYIPLFLEKKELLNQGSCCNSWQFFSTFMTLLIVVYTLISLIFINTFFISGFMGLIILQVIPELIKHPSLNHRMKMVIFSLLGIQIINIGILFGVLIFFYKILFGKKIIEK